MAAKRSNRNSSSGSSGSSGRSGRPGRSPGKSGPNRAGGKGRSSKHQAPQPSLARKAAGGDIPEELADASRGERLQKVLAAAGVASRRECEQIIAEGRVEVNGQVVSALPAWADPINDRITIDGRLVAVPKRNAGAQLIYIALHKPRHVISTTDDPEGRRAVTDLVDLPPNVSRRVYPVGRLDADSTGLVLMTNDGELANRITHPKYGITKKYEVSVSGRVTQEQLAKLQKGFVLANPVGGRGGPREDGTDVPVKTKHASVESVRIMGFQRDSQRGDRTRLAVTLSEGQNREIRRLFARVGLKVKRLKRIGVGPLGLKGLPPGAWRFLDDREVNAIKREAGMATSRKRR
jgi:pseudouridine synthase